MNADFERDRFEWNRNLIFETFDFWLQQNIQMCAGFNVSILIFSLKRVAAGVAMATSREI